MGSWLQGRIPVPASRASLPRVGLICITVGTATVALAVRPELPVAVAVAGWAVAGLGMGLLYPSLSVLTLELSAPVSRAATARRCNLVTPLRGDRASADRGRAGHRECTGPGQLRDDPRGDRGPGAARGAAGRSCGGGREYATGRVTVRGEPPHMPSRAAASIRRR
ncbi:hypothetical protein NKG94_35925 [Micromonospora sp. M12]